MPNQKILWLSLTWLAALVLALYYHYYLGMDVVYTHFFYFVLAVTTIYSYRYVIPAAFFLGGLHVLLGYLSAGAVTDATLSRALMMLLVALIMYTIENLAY